jgi:hypothetical protein
MQMGQSPSTVKPERTPLAAAITVAKIWKSPRNRRVHARVDLSEHKGHLLVNIRLWETGSDGIDRPTVKGIALAIRKLPELARALAKAETKARELGLLEVHQDGTSEPSEAAE